MKPVILSGVQPSGELHLGNYLGAISEHLRIDTNKNKAFFFIADYHALTTIRDPKVLRENTYDVAATYLALGLDEQAHIFRQSDVPLTTELMWILSTVTGMGLLNRAPAYKEKIDKGIPPSVGLFSYPLLMAADILLFGSNIVPVGQDQIPHIEIARDVAAAFNAQYGEVLTIPEYRLTATPKVPGIDGEKMSKSYKNTIPIFSDPKKVEKIIKSIKTSGVDYTKEPMNPEGDIVFTLYSLLATPEEAENMRLAYLHDRGFGYGHAKKRLLALYNERFGAHYDRYCAIRADEDRLETRLATDADYALDVALATMRKVREAVGLPDWYNYNIT